MENLAISVSLKGNIAKYPAKSHARRVGLATRFNDGLVVVEGEKSAYYSSSDQKRHFRQNRYFYYLTGCNEPDCYVSYDIKHDLLTLWLPPINLSRVFYDGRGSTVEEALDKYDVDCARYIEPKRGFSSLDFVLSRNANSCARIMMLTPVSGSLQRYTWRIENSGKLKAALDTCRAVKDADEVALVRKANDVSSKAHREVLKQLRHLRSEAEVEGLFLNVCVANGAQEQAYTPIAGSGPNAGILHYIANNEKFGDRQLLLIDASCEYDLYASDITRTMPLNAKNPGYWPSSESEAVYKAVQKIQEECISLIRPGISFGDVHLHGLHMEIDALLGFGILKGAHDDIFKRGTANAFAPHGVGHHIGLEVHDIFPPWSEDRPELQNATEGVDAYSIESSTDPLISADSYAEGTPPLEPGNIVTIEPGIYFNKFILEKFYLNEPRHRDYIDREVLRRYMPVGGVRIEDCILVTKDGYDNLTTAVKGEEMLKVIRGEA